MKLYQVDYTCEAGNSAGYGYFGNKREAAKASNLWRAQGNELEHGAEIRAIEVEPTKSGILKALNRFASHANNG